MTSLPILLPMPRRITHDGGHFHLPDSALIHTSPATLFEAQLLQDTLQAAGMVWDIVAHAGSAPTSITFKIDTNLRHAQGYRLTVTPDTIAIRAADAAGVYYAVCTLRQLIEQYGHTLPCMTIEDHPDFPERGVMLDVSRDKVPTMDTLHLLIEKLAAWKVNQIQLYTEHTFAYRGHPEVWADASPLTGQDILELDAFCRKHHIQLVPNQNSLGHMERWLKHERYLPLAESPEDFTPPWGGHSAPTTLNPLDPGSLDLIGSLYDELLPHFTSGLFNIGGDEPWELGQGKSKQAVEERGGRVYLDYLLKLHEKVTAHGRQMQFWGDIILHYPDLVPHLPKDVIAMEWGYESTHDFEGHCKLFAESGIPFYVCPGTSSWNTLVGRTENTLENQRNAVVSGLKYGAIGYLNTDWGDSGHWQPLSISYAGFAVGAAFSWCYATNQALDLPTVLDTHVFKDHMQVMGKLVTDLGNLYKLIGPEHINGQILAYVLQQSSATYQDRLALLAAWGGGMPNIAPDNLKRAMEQLKTIIAPLDAAAMGVPDATIIQAELRHATQMVEHGAHWLLLLQEAELMPPDQLLEAWEHLAESHRSVWLARNRPGGLADSLARFDTLRHEYQQLKAQ